MTSRKRAVQRKPIEEKTSVDAVSDLLRSYAARGVFREFAVQLHGTRRADYRFVWLTARSIRARYDAKSSLFTLLDLLPGIKPHSKMDLALRAFVAGRFGRSVLPHRRLSRALIPKLTCINKRRSISLRLTLNQRKPAEGTRQALLLVSEIFQNFLAGPYHDYMVRYFDIRED